MSTTHHRQHNLNHVYGVGITVLVAASSCLLSGAWITGNWAYSTYLKPKIAVVEVSESRKELEAKHRELLHKSGFKSDVNLKSVSDEGLKAANHKLETALRAGK
jgi:hypothetical protein